MSDFEQWLESQDEEEASMFSSQWRIGWNAAIASMQGEAVEYQIKILGERWTHCAKHIYDPSNPNTRALFTYPPSASAEIARLTKELEEARKDAERYRMVRSLDVTQYDKWSDAQKALHRAINSADTVEMVDAAVDAALSKIGGGE